MHIAHLDTAGGKMSKSKGEFTTVSTLEERGYDPLVYRLFCLQSHYRKALVFTWENLNNAKTAYEKLVNRVAALTEEGEVDPDAVAKYREAFREALGNDLNTSLGVTRLYDVLGSRSSRKTTAAWICFTSTPTKMCSACTPNTSMT